MAKALKSKIVLDLAEFNSSLDNAERRYRKTVAELEKGSGVGINKMRLDLGGGHAEYMAQRKEALLAARTGREQFDAQIGGGLAVAKMTTFNRGLADSSRGFADMAAKAWSAKTAIDMTFSLGKGVVYAFRGEIDKAREALENMPVTGKFNAAAFGAGKWVSDTFVEKGVHSGAEEAQKELEASEKRAVIEQARIRKQQAFEEQSKRMAYERQLMIADEFTADQIRIRQFAEEQTQALKRSGIDPNSEAYKSREGLIRQTTDVMQSKAEQDEADRRRVAREADERRQVAVEESARREAEQREQQAKRMASDVAAVEAELAAKVLDIQGRKQEAEAVRTKDYYRQRIEDAREAGNQELARLLEAEQRIALASGTRTTTGRPEQLAEQVIQGRFLKGDESMSKSSKMPIIGDPQQTEYLKQMADGFARGIPARAV